LGHAVFQFIMSKRSPMHPGPWHEFVLLDVILPVKAFLMFILQVNCSFFIN